ncbi:MAG TPA: isoprenylcysteine carboxylmethyltransferase family protein [Anaerolineaceae bacterium]|nr:isoprenylcysteine carboxylmethyltransferase family protein [Anaerolineaceae bacterium]
MQTGFWWILLALALYGVIHSVLAAHRTKEVFRNWWGERNYQRFYRLFFSLQALVLFVPVLYLVVVLPDQIIYRIPSPWVYLTIALQILAVVGIVHTIMLTGMLRFTGVLQAVDPAQSKKPVALVIRSLYRWVRHPIYTSMFFLVWLVPVMSWNILALAIGISFYNVLGAILEERKLINEFGQAYEDYRRSTPFIIPGLKF